MQYRILGKTNLKVSALGMGCSGIGKSLHHRDNDEALITLREAYDSGINFFDTAPNYSNGESEILIMEALKENRDKIIISSKAGVTFTSFGTLAKKIKPILYPVKEMLTPVKKNSPNLFLSQRRSDFSKEFIINTVEGSLKRLQTEYIDLLFLHHPTDQILESGDFLETFELLKSQGKIRYYGISCDSVEQAEKGLKLRGISAIQIELNMLDQAAITRVLPEASKNNIGVIARLPLAKGLLTNHTHSSKAERWAYDRQKFENRRKEAEKFKFLVNEKRTVAQSALKFLMQLDEVAVTLIGFNNRIHLRENLGSLSAPLLTQEGLQKIYSL